MTTSLYVAGEFYGIQKYVLGISATGSGQAKRLRARSFYVQVLEDVVVRRLMATFSGAQTLMQGGGQFVIEVPRISEAEAALTELRTSVQSELFRHLQGQLGFNLAWSETVVGALRGRSRERRRPWCHVMADASGWITSRMAQPSIAPPCEVCGKREASTTWTDDDTTEEVCARCKEDRQIGAEVTKIRSISVESNGRSNLVVLGRKVVFHSNQPAGARLLRRYVPIDAKGRLLTFEEIAQSGLGAPLLGVLKADVDNFGSHLARLIEDASNTKGASELSKDLDQFFSIDVQNNLEMGRRSIYTVYSGGDDLFLVGPWNDMLAVAIEIRNAFAAGPGKKHTLTISAGVAFTPPGIPVRHAASRAQRLLSEAKKGEKNKCAVLEGAWQWSEISSVCNQGAMLTTQVNKNIAPRTLLHRFRTILSKRDDLTHSRWAYHMARHFQAHRSRTAEEREFERWCESVDESWNHPVSPQSTRSLEIANAVLLYALIATRPTGGSYDPE